MEQTTKIAAPMEDQDHSVAQMERIIKTVAIMEDEENSAAKMEPPINTVVQTELTMQRAQFLLGHQLRNHLIGHL